MLVMRAYKYRIYPNKEVQEKLARQFGCVRFVYNYFLDKRITHYEQTGKGLTYNQTSGMLTKLKKKLEWLNDAHSQVLQASLGDLDAAYTNFFSGRAKFPNFKSKRGKQSCRYPQGFKFEGNYTYLPKIGWVKTVFHRKLQGTLRRLTVSKTKSGKYFISVVVEENIEPHERINRSVGIDLGLKDFLVTSDGYRIPAPKYLRKSEQKLKRLQRQLSRKQEGSNNREKARRRLARQHEKVTNQRKDFQHKTSKWLIDSYDYIALEDLNIKGMVKNHKLAKSIQDAGWGEFVRQLEYKGNWYGADIARIDRFYPSSKRHFACGWIKEDLTLSDREWHCENCGETVDRDINAAMNILNFTTVGTTESNAWGDLSVDESLNQEADVFRPLVVHRGTT